MYGKQDTGKSFFPELLEHIIGEQFFVKRKMADMENRFAASDLWGSKIFVDDDVKANLKLPDDFIKFYSGEKSITIEKKNRDAIKGVKISVAMFFISNHSFSVSGGVEGIERRMIYIPFYKEIENPDVFLKEKIIGLLEKGEESGQHKGKTFDERPAIIGMALRGIDMLIKNNHHFTMPSWVSKERDRWLVESDSVTQFLHDKIYDNIQIITPKEMYEKYKEWCEEESKKPYGKNNFYEKVRMQKRIETGRSVTGDVFRVKGNIKPVEDYQDEIPF
jgi:phage/plasmid-associated DNA primase